MTKKGLIEEFGKNHVFSGSSNITTVFSSDSNHRFIGGLNGGNFCYFGLNGSLVEKPCKNIEEFRKLSKEMLDEADKYGIRSDCYNPDFRPAYRSTVAGHDVLERLGFTFGSDGKYSVDNLCMYLNEKNYDSEGVMVYGSISDKYKFNQTCHTPLETIETIESIASIMFVWKATPIVESLKELSDMKVNVTNDVKMLEQVNEFSAVAVDYKETVVSMLKECLRQLES